MSLYSDPVKRRFQELGKLLYRNYENTTFVYFSFTIIRYSYAKNRSPGRPSLKKNMLPGGGGGGCVPTVMSGTVPFSGHHSLVSLDNIFMIQYCTCTYYLQKNN